MVVALRVGLFRHGRTGQHLALGVTEELEEETFQTGSEFIRWRKNKDLSLK